MNRLSKEKRDQLILVGIATAAVIAGLWYLVVTMQRGKLAADRKAMAELQGKIDGAEKLLRQKAQFDAELQATRERLDAVEATMLPVDREYPTMFETIKGAVRTSNVEFRGDLNKAEIRTMDLLPSFPYKAAVFTDTAFYGCYHEFGKFLADMENNYPHWLFQVTRIKHPDTPEPAKRDCLSIQVRIIALVQSPQR